MRRQHMYYSTQYQNLDLFKSTGFVIFCVVIAVIYVIAYWKIFEKAGEPGWGAIIPFYNMYLLFKITWGNGLLFLLIFVPIANFVIEIITMVKLSNSFGQGGGFACGLIFLPVIFWPLLGFGNYAYIGVNGKQQAAAQKN